MKILVTGGAGFIGSNVVDGYLVAGHEVIVVDNLSTGHQRNLNPAARFYQMDLRAPELAELIQKEKPDVVNHHAAQIDVRRSVADPAFDASINILGSLSLLEACRTAGVKKVIYISSGGAIYGEPDYLPCDEAHPVRPLSPYGGSKYAVELYLFMYGQNYGLPYTILRYANVYGPRQDPLGEAGVVAIFTDRMLKGEPVTINGTGEQERDFIFVGDCVAANLLALEMGEGRAYNLGWGLPVTVNDIYRRLKEASGYRLDANYSPAKTGETFRIYLDTARARQELGWEPKVPLEEGIGRTVRFFQEQGR